MRTYRDSAAAGRRGRARSATTWTLGVVIAGVLLGAPAPAVASSPGQWTQTQVNDAIQNGVAYLDTQQNSNGSFGSTYPGAETALALVSYGVKDSGHFANLPTSPVNEQAIVQNALSWLLTQQNPMTGAFATDGVQTYDTGLALTALSFMGDVPTMTPNAVSTAITNGRNFLIGSQKSPANGFMCQTDGANGTGLGGQSYCGGWNYDADTGQRSDESNTGFAITGLDLTGGLPAAVAQINAGWQRNVQEFSGNTYPAARNDGGASYEPGIDSGNFSSNANDTGSNLFGYGYDGIPASDPAVQASLKFAGDVLDEYELMKATTPRVMVYHTGMTEDGTCMIGGGMCDWSFGTGEGGYHYSMFTLAKGFSQYVPSSLSDPNNWYAKVVDLLLSQQASDGSWPADLRDDASVIAATGFAILSLGHVGAPGMLSGTVFNDANGNGIRDAGEAGLGGWTVFVDLKASGNDDPGDPSAVTAADGTYNIQNVPNGTFNVRVVPQAGFNCTKPNPCVYSQQMFASGVSLTGLDFGESMPASPPAPAKAVVVVAATKLPGGAVLPSTAKCASKRTQVMHPRFPRGAKLLKVRIFINGKAVKTVKFARASASALIGRKNKKVTITLRGLPKGTFTIRMVETTSKGVYVDTRRYHTCIRGIHHKLKG